MQFITRNNKNIHPLLDELDNLYHSLSNTDSEIPLFSHSYSSCFKELVNIFNEHIKPARIVKYRVIEYDKLDLPEYDSKNIIICFSGGKDSIATVLHYKELGYNIYLYYMKGINKCYPNEHKTVQKVADYLCLPLFIDEIKLSGNHQYIEHPMKNMIIANGVLSYGISEGIGTNIAFGNYYTSMLSDNPFEICAGDCKDMWEIYERIIRNIIPNFKIHIPLQNINTSLEALLEDKHLLELSQSCIGTHRFREYKRKMNIEKYNVELMPGRCGCCWKCAVEYIYYTDHNILCYNKMYYKYCLQVLLNTIITEGNTVYSIEELWTEFMFYDIKQSKLQEVQDATIQGKKIKYPK